MARSRGRRSPLLAPLVAVVVVIAVLAAGVLTREGDGLGGTGLFGALHRSSAPTPTTTPRTQPAGPTASATPAPSLSDVPTVLAALTPAPAVAPPAGAALVQQAASRARAGLGSSSGFSVVDATTGAVLYAADPAAPHTPASTLKVLTATAALATLGAQTRLVTSVRRAADGTVVLVGGGDPTLTAAAADGIHGADGGVDTRASLPALAAATAARLRAAPPAAPVQVAVDDSAFTGPAVSPHWPPGYLSSGVVAPVSALSVDEARVHPERDRKAREYQEGPRVADPALAAGTLFAQLLAKAGVPVSKVPVSRVTVSRDAPELAEVRSPPLRRLVELMLTRSDNDLAEAMLRLVGRSTGQGASFTGGAAGVRQVLSGLGVPVAGLAQYDGSGLSRDNRVSPATLAAALRATSSPAHPELRGVLTGLPVAGFSGTLSVRSGSGAPAGVVRAKTGTLTGVSALAGTVVDQDGRQLVFAVLADRVPVTGRARAALDSFASTLHRCGCMLSAPPG